MVYVLQQKIAHHYLTFQGDLSVLRPTFMCGVPVMLDRIYKGVLAKIKAKGTFSYKLFEYAVDYRTLWLERGYDTPLFDKFLFIMIIWRPNFYSQLLVSHYGWF